MGKSMIRLDRKQAAERIAWFVDNRSRLAAMSAASQEISQKFTVARAVDSIVDAIEDLLGEKK